MPHTAYIDGGSRGNPGPAAAGVQIRIPAGRVIFAGGLFLGHQTNNEAEYAGLVLALDLLHAAEAAQIRIRSDSELLVRQMQGQYRVKAANLKPLYDRAAAGLRRFAAPQFEHVPRERNKEADALVNQALDAVADVVTLDVLHLLSKIRRPAVAATPAGPFAPAPIRASAAASRPLTVASDVDRPDCDPRDPPLVAGIIARVIKPPRASGCPARIRAGQVFPFADTVPAGLCLHACSATIEAVLAMRSIAVDRDAGPFGNRSPPPASILTAAPSSKSV